jgi:hypothetical protein
VSATLVHPLTETRLPTLAQTSALATPEGCTTEYISGIDGTASSAIPTAIQGRTHNVIAVSFAVTGRPARVMESTGNAP